MFHRWRLLFLIWLTVGVGLLALAGTLQDRLVQASKEYELVVPREMGKVSPEIELLRIVPGGLRAPLVSYLWIRAQTLKNQGRYFDAKQLADLICTLQPKFASVWRFHAWNMAWNISVATHSADERWHWITNGMKLLRERGIPTNPKSIMLHHEMAWIFFSKIGGNTDEKHLEYKQRWASEMQQLLGAPVGGITVATSDVIEAFRPIAAAPLDKSIDRQANERIQADQIEVLTQDPLVAAYLKDLEKIGLGIDERLLGIYNAISSDESAAAVRPIPYKPTSDIQRAFAKVINDPAHTEARTKILAFLRAQILWNVYYMDPDYMFELMVTLDAPLDWRLPWPHAIYWARRGIERAGVIGDPSIRTRNIERIVLGSVKALISYGRMSFVENPRNPNAPKAYMAPDWRYIEPTHQQYLLFIQPLVDSGQDEFDSTQLAVGHANFLEYAVQMMVAMRRLDQANRYYRVLKDDYGFKGNAYDETTAEDFIIALVKREGDELRLASNYAIMQITVAMEMAFVHLSQGDTAGFRRSFNYANAVYKFYQRDVDERLSLGPIENIAGERLISLLVRPRAIGYNISLVDRAGLYAAVGHLWPGLQLAVYDLVAPSLAAQARLEEIDFVKAFPAPDGLVQYRAKTGKKYRGLRPGM